MLVVVVAATADLPADLTAGRRGRVHVRVGSAGTDRPYQLLETASGQLLRAVRTYDIRRHDRAAEMRHSRRAGLCAGGWRSRGVVATQPDRDTAGRAALAEVD